MKTPRLRASPGIKWFIRTAKSRSSSELRIVEFCRNETEEESIRILRHDSSCTDEAEEVWKNFLLPNLWGDEHIGAEWFSSTFYYWL